MAESNYFPPKGGAAKAEKNWKLGRAVCYNHHRRVLMYSLWRRGAFVAVSGVC